MATDRQIAANRRNAQQSTGPQTLAGKMLTRHSGVRHGLRAGRAILKFEVTEEFTDLHDELLAELQPAGPTETTVFEQIVLSCWRMRRAGLLLDAVTQRHFRIAEEADELFVIDEAHFFSTLGIAFDKPGAAQSVEYFSRLEGRYRNAWYRARRELAQLQRDRAKNSSSGLAAVPEPVPDAPEPVLTPEPAPEASTDSPACPSADPANSPESSTGQAQENAMDNLKLGPVVTKFETPQYENPHFPELAWMAFEDPPEVEETPTS